jgi:hypothetical protein
MSYEINDAPDPLKALAWMRDNAEKLANAKAERAYIDQFLKSKKATLMQELSKTHGALAAQEREALAHPEFLELLKAHKEAVFAEEKIKALMTAAQNQIEIWRTIESTKRAELKAF